MREAEAGISAMSHQMKKADASTAAGMGRMLKANTEDLEYSESDAGG